MVHKLTEVFECGNIYALPCLEEKVETTNYQFLEEYKKLDKLCREMYESDKGVTSYIDDMKGTPNTKSDKVRGWSSDLRTLIHLRHIRNRLSHDVGTFDTDICTQEDIDALMYFHGRILNGTDPLSQLTKAKREPVKTAAKQEAAKEPVKKSGGCVTYLITLAVFTVIVLIIMFATKTIG